MNLRSVRCIALIGLVATVSQTHAQALSQTQAPALPARYSADALYNDANRYARDGKPGLAVLDYERARLLAPDDPDIDANLNFVRASQHLPTEPPSNFRRAVTFASPTLLAWTGVFGLLLAGACLLAGQVSPRRRGLRRAGVTLGCAFMALTVCNGLVLWPALNEAVVLTDASPVRVSPVPMGDPLFVLPEAETVRITAEHDEYVLVQTGSGKTGWMARANVAPVVPRP